MSLTLELYSASWDDIGTAVACRNRKLFRTILKEIEADLSEDYDAEDFDDGPDFEEGLERWIMGEVQVEQKTPPFQVVHLGEALAFVGLIKHFGRRVGTLAHSSAAGFLFRDKFLGEAAPKFLVPPFSLTHLLSRQVLGYENADLPFWGGLRAPELSALAPRLEAEAPTWSDNSVIDEWLKDLWAALGSSLDSGKELISVYF
jgi:hypothetical protein